MVRIFKGVKDGWWLGSRLRGNDVVFTGMAGVRSE